MKPMLLAVIFLTTALAGVGHAFVPTARELSTCQQAIAQSDTPERLNQIIGNLPMNAPPTMRPMTMRDWLMSACLSKVWRWDHDLD